MSIGSGDPSPDLYKQGDPNLMAKMPAQDPMSLLGKTLRLKDDGTVPNDNPFVGKTGSRREIYTIGHRDHHGIAAHPTTGQIFHVELGPLGADDEAVGPARPTRSSGDPRSIRRQDGESRRHPDERAGECEAGAVLPPVQVEQRERSP